MFAFVLGVLDPVKFCSGIWPPVAVSMLFLLLFCVPDRISNFLSCSLLSLCFLGFRSQVACSVSFRCFSFPLPLGSRAQVASLCFSLSSFAVWVPHPVGFPDHFPCRFLCRFPCRFPMSFHVCFGEGFRVGFPLGFHAGFHGVSLLVSLQVFLPVSLWVSL